MYIYMLGVLFEGYYHLFDLVLLAVRCGEEGAGFRLYGLASVSAHGCYSPRSRVSYRVKVLFDRDTESIYMSRTHILNSSLFVTSLCIIVSFFDTIKQRDVTKRDELRI